MRTKAVLISFVLGTLAGPLVAQVPVTPADSALAACSSAAQGKQEAQAKTAASRAEQLFKHRIAADKRDADAHVGLARVITECRLPFASFMGKGKLSGDAVELLQAALAIDSTHWSGRYSLAMNFYHTPEFLGRTNDAIREFERLVAQQGTRANPPIYAQSYVRLGDLYQRRKRTADAQAMWRRGIALFPDNQALRDRIAEHERRTEVPVEPAPRPAAVLNELVVSASANRMDDTRSGTSVKRLDVLMTPGGAADLMQAFQTGPGTTRVAEGSDLYVLGGDPAEAPVWVDGARLFYAGRYESLHGGAFGVLDPAVLAGAFFSSGGFSARYGNALSGVLDVETLGLPDVRAGVLSANTVAAGGMMQAPVNERFGVWGAGRATEGTLMLTMHNRLDEFSVAPRSLEGMMGAVWQPRPGWSFKAVGLLDADESARQVSGWGYTGPFASHGSNRLVSLTGRALGADGRAALRANLSVSSRTSGFEFGVMDRERTDQGITARVDGDVLVAGGRLRAGIEAAAMDADHTGVVPSSDQLGPGAPTERLAEDPQEATHLGGYAEWEWAPLSRLGIVAGLRADRLPGEDTWTVDPRIAVALRAGDWAFRLGGGEFHQGRWRTRYVLPNPGLPSGTPRRARHLVAGVERRGEPSVKVEAYTKTYDEYVPAGEGPPIEAGRASGADAIVRWTKQDRLNGWITYSLLRGRVDLEDGQTVPSAVDVTHSITAVAMLKLPYDLQLGNTLRYATGRPYTPHVDGEHGPVHGDRLPMYVRLDTRLMRFWNVRGRMLVTYVEMLNTTDRANIAGYAFDDTTGERTEISTFFGQRTVVFGGSINLR